MSGIVVKYDVLKDFCYKLLRTQNVPEDEAEIIAAHLVEAEARGVVSHGVQRTSLYVNRLKSGVVNSAFDYEIEEESGGTVRWNAKNSMGMVTGVKAMEYTMKKAKENGICLTLVNHSNHFGMAGYYAQMASENGFMAVCGTNAPPTMAPTGSFKAFVGTNPIAVSAPMHGDPMMIDMAPSVVAKGKIIFAQKLGKPIPEGWAITADGKPTTDPAEAINGTVLPIGGPKGYGLSLFMDVFCGILSGAVMGPYLGNLFNDFVNPQNVGHLFCAIDVSRFMDLEAFKVRMDQMKDEIKALPKAEGVSEIFLPGEIEFRKRHAAFENGISLTEPIFEDLKKCAEENGVAFTL